jgi:hypothetical protein
MLKPPSLAKHTRRVRRRIVGNTCADASRGAGSEEISEQ